MNLLCGNCRCEFRYDPTLAGRAIQCRKCGQAISMLPLERLPPDIRDGYLAEVVGEETSEKNGWEIAPLNVSEPEVAARLIPALHGGGYILGDKA
jgi:hypothetical protein